MLNSADSTDSDFAKGIIQEHKEKIYNTLLKTLPESQKVKMEF